MKNTLIILFLSLSVIAKGSNVQKVEPLSWWVGMNTPLQIMLYGEDLKGFTAKFIESDLQVIKVHNADSPNYLFIDVAIKNDAKARDYTLRLTRADETIDVKYKIEHRRKGSANRESFNSSDLVYLIMPDRFVNGDITNDSTDDTVEKANKKNIHGRYGGDIKGVINKLDYLEDLGVTALWSTPMLLDDEAIYSYHGYACADYYKIDPRYGTNEQYRTMVKKAHKKGIKVIMDVVLNHCGIAHWWMKDLPYKNWIHEYTKSNGMFSTVSDPNRSEYDLKGCINSWFDLPMPDMAIEENKYLQQYFKQVFIWWVESADLDGLRVDTYPYNDKIAAADWTRAIRAEYPNINIVGECWSSAPAIIAYWDGGAENRDGYNSNLSSVMDFSLQESIIDGISSDKTEEWGEGVVKIYNSLSQDFVYKDPNTLMIFLDNHDTPRLADMMDGDIKKAKLAMTILATTRGVPQLYSGSELMFKSDDLSQGHGGARIGFPGGWSQDSLNLFDAKDRNAEQTEMFEYTKKLFNWRKNNPTIHNGKLTHFIPQDNLYVYFRYDVNKAVMIIINASDKTKEIDWKSYQEITNDYSNIGKSPIDSSEFIVGKPLTIAPKSSVIIEFNKQ